MRFKNRQAAIDLTAEQFNELLKADQDYEWDEKSRVQAILFLGMSTANTGHYAIAWYDHLVDDELKVTEAWVEFHDGVAQRVN